jgi:hypothetical protein
MRALGGCRSGVAWTVLRAALIWAPVGMCVAAAICFFRISGFAVFLFADAGPAALVLGVIEGSWLYYEKSKTANAHEFIRFGFISGAGLGLLALPPALAQSDASFVDWISPAVFVVAALVGGGIGGVFSASSFRISASSREPSHSILRLIAGYCLVLVPVGLAEYSHYGTIVQTRLKVLAALSKASVYGLPAGNATGSRWSGCYDVNYHNIGESGVGGGLACLTQVDGKVAISEGRDPNLEGGIDSNGRFWAGRDTTFNDLDLRVLWNGEFTDNSRFQYSERATVLKNGRFSNSTIAEGSGHRKADK